MILRTCLVLPALFITAAWAQPSKVMGPMSADMVQYNITDGTGDRARVTFLGLPTEDYERPELVRQAVREKLGGLDPHATVILVYGLAMVHTIAQEMNFETVAIAPFSQLDQVQAGAHQVYLVQQSSDSGISPLARVYSEISDEIHAYGGSQATAEILTEAKKVGVPVSFYKVTPKHGGNPAEVGWTSLGGNCNELLNR